jgi:hypothetical protein
MGSKGTPQEKTRYCRNEGQEKGRAWLAEQSGSGEQPLEQDARGKQTANERRYRRRSTKDPSTNGCAILQDNPTCSNISQCMSGQVQGTAPA